MPPSFTGFTEKKMEDVALEIEYDHPKSRYLRTERLPHIWCPGCGIGIVLNSYLEAVGKSGIPAEDIVLVSGIGCTARLPGYSNIDSYHTIHGRGIAFATGMKVANPALRMSVISGDGDLFNIGGNHIMHAARRNVDMLVICVNNFNYGMTGGQHGATTPIGSRTASSPYGSTEDSFNLPYIMAALGASYVARWTVLHVRQLVQSITRGMKHRGFSFIEILSTCPPNFGKDNNFPSGFSEMEHYRQFCTVDNTADLREISIDFLAKKPIVLGEFVNERRKTYHEREEQVMKMAQGDQQ